MMSQISTLDAVGGIDLGDLKALKEHVDKLLAARAIATERSLRENLLEGLRHGTWVKLGVSRIEGVGVIAVREIPEDTNPFDLANGFLETPELSVEIQESDLRKVDPEIVNLFKSFFAPLTEDDGDTPYRRGGDIVYGANALGLNALNVGWYMNHSDHANVQFFQANHHCGFSYYRTRTRICVGEELTIDYRELGSGYYAQLRSTSTSGKETVCGEDDDVDIPGLVSNPCLS